MSAAFRMGSMPMRRLSYDAVRAPGTSRSSRTPPAAALLTAAGALPFVFYAAQHSPDVHAIPRGDSLLEAVEAGLRLPVGALSSMFATGDQVGVRRAFVGYGACIVSFLGAVHWGAAMVAPVPSPASRFVASVLPSLAGWAAMRSQDSPSTAPGAALDRLPIVILAGSFFAMYAYDEMAVRVRRLPAWYSFVRTPGTLVAVGSCIAAAKLAAPADDSARHRRDLN